MLPQLKGKLNGLSMRVPTQDVSLVDLSGLKADAGASGSDSVLNGIAWDAGKKRLFVTGKYWPKLYEITLADCG